ncbi:hypothetical protein ACIPC1_18715 [Streptomyces sp. NPDC087263]|uniref:hypothetical protein n=1 Tax=Streptomyces sp. NPDC087263 TaxID=3365773 RepID=UPI00382289D8
MTRRIPSGTGRSDRSRRIAAALLAMLACGAALVSCGSDSDNDSGTSVSPRPTAPDESSFAGEAPSALASEAASAIGSVQASASAATSSASAEASAFEASVSADTARAAAAAQAELKNVRGSGNARSEVAVTGLPRARTGGLLAVLVAITNKSDQQASYAVQIDFEDSDGKVVESRFVGAQDLEPGERAEPVAISREPVEPRLTSRLAKAQRY